MESSLFYELSVRFRLPVYDVQKSIDFIELATPFPVLREANIRSYIMKRVTIERSVPPSYCIARDYGFMSYFSD